MCVSILFLVQKPVVCSIETSTTTHISGKGGGRANITTDATISRRTGVRASAEKSTITTGSSTTGNK